MPFLRARGMAFLMICAPRMNKFLIRESRIRVPIVHENDIWKSPCIVNEQIKVVCLENKQLWRVRAWPLDLAKLANVDISNTKTLK